MAKLLSLVVVTGAIAIAAGFPVALGRASETRDILLMATAFFGIASAIRAGSKGSRRGPS